MARSDRRPTNPAAWRRCAGAGAAVLVAVLAVLVVMTAIGGPAPAAPADDPTAGLVLVAGVKPQSDGAVTAVVSPPRSQSGGPLAADAFTVKVDRSEVASRARPRDPADLAVAIVVQTAAKADMPGEKGAAVETILELPDATRTVVVEAAVKSRVLSDLGTDRRDATTAVGDVPAGPGASAVPALDLAMDEIADAPRRAIILFGPVGFADGSDIETMGERLLDEGVSLFVVARNLGPARLDDVVLESGGRSLAGDIDETPDALVGAGQSIAVQLASQHLVTFTPDKPLTSRSRVTIASAAVSGSESLVPRDLLPSGRGKARDRVGDGGGRGSGLLRGHDLPWKPAAAAAVAAALVLGLVLLLRRRRRAKAGPAFRVKTARAVIAAPEPGGEVEAIDAMAAVLAPPPPDATGGNGASPDPDPEPVHRARPARTAAPRAGQVDEALDRLETFAARWQPRSQGVFFAHEALAMHRRSGLDLHFDELCRATALEVATPDVAPVVRTIDALRWSLVRRSQGGRWSDIAVEASAVLRGEFDPSVVLRARGAPRSGDLPERPAAQLERLRGRRVLEDEVKVREPVRAAAIVRERVLEYQWFGAESELVSRILVPVLLYDRVPASVPYLAVSRHLGASTDMSEFFEAATEAADEATRLVIQLRALRTRYQAELDGSVQAVVELLFSVPVVTAGYLAERLDASAATVTDLMDHLVSAGVVEAVVEPTRRGDPAWVATEVIGVFERRTAAPASISLSGSETAESEHPDRGTHRRRAAPVRPRQLRTRPRP